MISLAMRNLGAALALVVATACSSGPYCDTDSANDALAAAAVGDTVELGSCEVMGPLRVPPGVELAGTGSTVVVAPVESGGIVALGGATTSVIRDLAVRVDGRIGVLIRGGGAAEVRDVTVDARRGIGLGASEMTDLTLTRVTLQGPIDAANANDSEWVDVLPAPAEEGACPDPSGCECDPGAIDEPGSRVCDSMGRWRTWTATFGLVLSGVTATLTDVDVRGFAQWGAVVTGGDVTWDGGGVHDTLGIGIRQVGGVLRLNDLDADHTFSGLRGDRPYAVLTSDDGRLETARVAVSDNDRYGVLIAGGTGLLEDLVAERNGDAALWVSESDDFELCGTATALRDNGFAGAVVVSSSNVRLADGAISTTLEQERPVGTLGLLRVGDGVQITDTRGAIELADLRLENNENAGLVVDLGAMGTGNVTFTMVDVTGTGTQLGAIAGRPSMPGRLTADAPMGWDSGVTRGGAVTGNDASFTGPINAVTEPAPGAIFSPGDPVAVVAPMF